MLLMNLAGLFPPLSSPAFSRPAGRKKELSFDDLRSSEASTSRGKEIRVRFQFRTICKSADRTTTSKLDSDPIFWCRLEAPNYRNSNVKNMKFMIGLLLGVTNSLAMAQVNENPCPIVIERPISFQTFTSKDRIKVEIGSGKCNVAVFSIIIYNAKNKVLHHYKSDLSQFSINWDQTEIATEAASFAIKTAEKGIVLKKNIPKPVAKDQITEDEPNELLISKKDYLRLSKNQPIFYHMVVHEGGYYFAYDPKIKKTVALVFAGH